MADTTAEPGKRLRFTPEHQRRAALAKHAASLPTALAQAVQIQHALHSVALALSRDVPECEEREERARVGTAMASVAKGWQSMQDQIRIIRGNPLPGSLRPASKPERKPKQAQVSPVLDSTSTVQPMPVQPSTDTP